MSELSRILIIGGMHRSGTSLITSWLKECGLFIGDELLAANDSNPKGYYEDLDFFHFHRGVLEDNHEHHFPKKSPSFKITSAHKDLARSIVEKKSNLQDQFGFKDPRTCLFLENIWSEVTPDAYSLFIVRHPNSVINSLLSRELLAQTKPWQKLKWRFARRILRKRFEFAYQLYNEAIINYYEANSTKSIVMEMEQLEKQAPKALVKLQQFGFQLKSLDISTKKDESLLHENANKKAVSLSTKTHSIYNRLKALSHKSMGQ